MPPRGSVRVNITGQATGLKRATAESEAALGRLGATTKRLRGTISSLTGGLAGYGLAAALYESGKSASEFQAQMERMHTTIGLAQKDIPKLSNAVEKLANKLPQGPQELAAGLYHVEAALHSSGISGAKALKVLTIAAKGAAVGGTDLESTANALTGAFVTGIKGAGNFRKVMAELTATAGAGNLTMQDLAESMGSIVLPRAKLAGLGIKDVLASLALLADENVNATRATRLLGTALHYLYDPSKQASNALEQIGLSQAKLVADLHKPQGLLVALSDIKEHLKGLSQAEEARVVGAIFPAGRGAVLVSLMNNLDRLKGKYKEIDEQTTHYSDSVQKAFQTQQVKLHEALSSIQTAGIKFGAAFLPAVVPAIQKFASWVQKISGPTAKFIKQMLHGKGAGGAFAEGIKSMVTGIGNLLKPLETVTKDILKFASAHPQIAKIAGEFLVIEKASKAIAGVGLLGALAKMRGAGAAGAAAGGIGTGAAAGGGALAALRLGLGRAVPVVGGLSVVNQLLTKTNPWNVPTADAFTKFGSKITGGWAGISKLKQFGDALTKLNQMTLQFESSGALKKLADHAHKLAGEFPDAKDALDSFANDAQRILRKRDWETWGQRIDDAIQKIIGNKGKDGFKGLNQAVARNMSEIRSTLGTESKQGQKAISQNFEGAITAVKKQMSAGVISTKNGMAEIRKLTSQELKAFGVQKNLKISGLPGPGNSGSDFLLGDQTGGGLDAAPGHARGGWIGNPGEHGRDKIHAVLGRGEAVLNRHQQGPVNAALEAVFGINLAGLFSKIRTPNYFAKGGFTIPKVTSSLRGDVGKIVNGALKLDRNAAISEGKRLVQALGMVTGRGGKTAIDGHPVANWIAQILERARKAGVDFTVSSGWRSDAQQKAIYDSGVRPAAKPKSEGGPGSNHEGTKFPLGAVDISPGASNLAQWLQHSPYASKLIYAGAKDPVHFSHPHGGGYSKGGFAGTYTATAYGPPWGGINGGGVTATGVDLKKAPHKYGIAVDPSVIPLGSKVTVWPNPFGYRGDFTAFDTGGAIKGNRIDFYDWQGRKAQMAWGVQQVTVKPAGAQAKAGGHTAYEAVSAQHARRKAAAKRLTTAQHIASRAGGQPLDNIDVGQLHAAKHVITNNLAKVHKALAGSPAPAQRKQLTAKADGLHKSLGQLNHVLHQVGIGKKFDFLDSLTNLALSRAQLTKTGEDDVMALTDQQSTIKQHIHHLKGMLKHTKSRRKRQSIMDTLSGQYGSLADVNQQLKSSPALDPFGALNRHISRQETKGLEAQVGGNSMAQANAIHRERKLTMKGYQRAVATHNRPAIQQFAQQLSGLDPYARLNARLGNQGAKLAEAQVSGSLPGQLAALRRERTLATKGYHRAVASGDTQGIQNFAQQIQNLGDSIKSLNQSIVQAKYKPFQTQLDKGNLKVLEAQVSGSTTDQLSALKGELATATAAYNKAKKAGDTDQIQTFGQDILDLRGSIDNLTQATQQNAQQLADLWKQRDQQDKRTNLIMQSQYGVLKAAIADAVGQHLSQRGFLAGRTPVGGGS